MKRRRSSPRSTLLVSEQHFIGSDAEESLGAGFGSGSNKFRRESAEPDSTGNAQSHVANTLSSSISPSSDMADSSQAGALKCSIPPTCSGRGKEVLFKNAADMERHHATYHTHTCLETGCGNVFPDARFLTLHQTECHDPLTDIRKERGERTFECFVDTCGRKFLTPKARRLHLIEAHSYPPEFFFAITNKGIAGLLERWGEGVSLVRGKWRDRSPSVDGSNKPTSPGPRANQEQRTTPDDAMSTDEDEQTKSNRKNFSPTSSPNAKEIPHSAYAPSKSTSSKPSTTANVANPSTDPKRGTPPHLMKPRSVAQSQPRVTPTNTNIKPVSTTKPMPSIPNARTHAPVRPVDAKKDAGSGGADAMDLDALTSTMTALSLVPRSVHFGRGKSAGLGHR